MVYSDNLIFPKKIDYKVDPLCQNGSRSKVVVFPLQNGFGTTIGNIMRRILLSSIGGLAVDSIKIEGISQEYSNIDGVKQSVPEIIFNIRHIVRWSCLLIIHIFILLRLFFYFEGLFIIRNFTIIYNIIFL